MGREKGTFPHSNGASFSEVGFFFPRVEPKATIPPAIPPARIKLTATPTYSFTTKKPRGQYTSSPASRVHRPAREAGGRDPTDQSDQSGNRERCGHRRREA